MTSRRNCRQYLLILALLVLGLCALGVACTPAQDGDDDDSGAGNLGPVGEPPVVTQVVVCEVPDSDETCEMQGYGDDSFQLQFQISVTDEDGDLDNPDYFLIIHQPPAISGWFEGSLGAGGTLALSICDVWTRGATFEYEVWVRDGEDNESERHSDTATVPASQGAGDCEPTR